MIKTHYIFDFFINLKVKKMSFQEIIEILNEKLTEIWAYRRYTSYEEQLCDS